MRTSGLNPVQLDRYAASFRALLEIFVVLLVLACLAFFGQKAFADTNLTMTCTAGSASGTLLNGSACTEKRYQKPIDGVLVASRSNGSSCDWTGADCQWRPFSALASNDQALVCNIDVPANAPWTASDPCGTGNTTKTWTAKALVQTGDYVINFTAATIVGAGSVTPALTWSTSPVATSCAASGDWSGSKAVSGTETLAAITQSKTYNIACTWPGQTTAKLTWVLPTKNTDGSALTDLKSTLILYGPSPTQRAQSVEVAAPATTYTFNSLAPATYYFGLRALNLSGVQSDDSNILSKTITTGTTVNRSVGIVVNPKPANPTGFTVE